TTAEPDPVVPLRLSAPGAAVLSPAAYGSTPPNPLGTGTGPFRITAHDPGRSLTVERHEGYWGGTARLDGVEVRFLPDAASRVRALRAGDVDVAEGVPASELAVLADQDDLHVETVAIPRTTTLYTNTSRGPLADPAVRRALSLAVDRSALV